MKMILLNILFVTINLFSQTPSIKPLITGPYTVGDSIWIDVKVGDPNVVTGLYGISFKLKSKNATLSYVDNSATAGTFLGASPLSFFHTVDEQTVDMAVTKTIGQGVDGSGIVARARYHINATGTDTLIIYDVSANDASGNIISFDTKELILHIENIKDIEWCNLQGPPKDSLAIGDSIAIYSRVWINNVTDFPGQGNNIQVWIGYHSQNTNPSTWTNWVPASYLKDEDINDEYVAYLGKTLTEGKYYFASRFRYGSNPYKYGGYSESSGISEGNFWDGVDYISGELNIKDTSTVPQIIEMYVPRYIGGKNGSSSNTVRMATVFGVRLKNLLPNKTYRITSGLVIETDGSTTSGAGNFWIPGITSFPNATAAGTLSTGTVSTNDSGRTAFCWIILQPTGNASRFNPGTRHYLRIGLNNGAGGTSINTWLTSSSSIIPLDISSTAYTAASDDDGAYIHGITESVAAGKFVLAYDLENRPISGYQIEDNLIDEGTSAPSFYKSDIAGKSNNYGIVIPSNSITGIRKIIAYNTDGTIYAEEVSDNGVWKGISTIQQSRASVVTLSTPLPVELANFTVSKLNQSIILEWSTATEIQNYGFDIEKKYDNSDWHKIAFIEGSGTSNTTHEYRYEDRNCNSGKYQYRLKQIDNDGTFKYFESATIIMNATLSLYTLDQNYPNPFNPSTTIRYGLPSSSRVSLKIYNVLGQQIADLVNTEQSAGWYETVWYANVSAGLYFYRMDAVSTTDPNKRFTQLKKMLFLK